MEDIRKCKAINIFFPIFVIVYISLSLLLGSVLQKFQMNLPIALQYIISELIVLTPAVIYVVLFKENVPEGISYKLIKPLDAILSLLAGYACVPLVLFISNLTSLFAENHLQESSSELLQAPFVLQVLLIAVLPPIVEEFVFRGLFFHTYRKLGIFAGALVSGIVFGLFHLNLNQFFYATVMGVVFAYLVEATGSLWASMLAHFAINTYSIGMIKLVELLSPEGSHMQEQLAETELKSLGASVIIVQMVILGLFAIGFLMLAFIIIRKIASRNGRLDRVMMAGRKNSEQEKRQLDEKPTVPIIGTKSGLRAILTWPLITTAVFCVIFMIYLEL